MEQELCEAAIAGNVELLEVILEKDSLILERVVAGFSTISPLHIAASHGHTSFVEKLLEKNVELTEVLDAHHRTALHRASAKGHVEVVEALVSKRPDMCLVCDKDGRNPIHFAAMEGKVEVLKILFEKKPHAARNRVNGGDTILHLCVKYDQQKSLVTLLDLVKGSEFVNAQDGSGNTVLHLAVSDKHLRMVQYLLDLDNEIKISVNATNTMDQTALDILTLAKTKEQSTESGLIKHIENLLRKASAKSGKDLVQRAWLASKRDAIMVVASLIATMAFQAGVSPPGGVWQDNNPPHYRAGEAVMAYNYPDSYPYFLRANTIGFVASLSTILFLISGLPFRKRAYMWCLVVIMWLTITSTAITYAFSITVVTPKNKRGPLSTTIMVGVIVWCSVMSILLLVHTFNLVKSVVQERRSKHKAIMYLSELNPIQCFARGVGRIVSARRSVSRV